VRRLTISLLSAATALAGLTVPAIALAGPVSPCGSAGTAPTIQHVILVMLENRSYKQVIGSSSAPFQTSLAANCGVATAMFGATHTSAANYLALSAGEYPASSPPGCGSIGKCADSGQSLYTQLDAAGLTWKAYEEAMPTACDSASSGNYKIGHNPVIFYTSISSTECQSDDVPVADLTAQAGAFWTDLQAGTLPSFSWVTPDLANDGENTCGGSCALSAADTWLKNFTAIVQASPEYQAGNTLLLVTYDEGTGADTVTGEDCTNEALDMPVSQGTSAHQDSCHVPFLVVYPYTPSGDSDGTFLDHYSVTRTIEDVFGLSYLAHAGDQQTVSLVGHFGIAG
jgi:phosphatidylinositol-3-phosphatase